MDQVAGDLVFDLEDLFGAMGVLAEEDQFFVVDYIIEKGEVFEGIGRRVVVDFCIGKNLDLDCRIAPLLLMPLVENAFKHGVKEATSPSRISISLKGADGALDFEVINTIAKEGEEADVKGLGLKNLKRRLELLYPGKHRLDVQNQGIDFVAQLKLTING